MKFSWDPKKERLNRRKHGIAFSEACYVFSDRCLLTVFDEKHSDDEDRWITMGQTPYGKILIVVHTYKEVEGIEFVRIISAREATLSEMEVYFARRA